MKGRVKRFLWILAVFVLAGCGGRAMKAVDIPTSPDEKLLWSSEPKRPGWTLEEPVTDNGVMSFVGLSGNFATEQLGRDDAQRNALNRVVSYTGTLVKDKFERARVSFGLDSNVVDPTTSARAFEKQLAVNIARQVKAKKWYIERWQMPTGVAHRVFVWAEVPQAAVDETMKGTARDMAKKAEQQAKEAGDEIAKKQAEKAAEFWKQMQEQGVSE
jgi:outer membrane lipopolysaccharide assembly protein LptE/RlpB